MDPSSGSSSAGSQETAKKKLYFALMREKWHKVVNIFKYHPEIQDTMMADMVPRKNESPSKHNHHSTGMALHGVITSIAVEKLDEKIVKIEKKVDKMFQDHPNLQVTNSIMKPEKVNPDKNDDNFDAGDIALPWAITNKGPFGSNTKGVK